ncbi:MAG: 1-deoxy-D-xylulose-5-phosphate synthase [Thermoleophilia bacterium]|nr:1-deoxy-D-xylulose-5-phosphate synthase [Thermoleophilia bacterium]
MRATFIRTLVELADDDPRIMLLTGDLGFTVVESFAERFPDRFFNVGVAEQNMVGVATGLAEAGFVPFVYSIATFATLRPYEFIRNGPVLHRLPVRIVGVGGGLDYGSNGVTHHALEDIAVMRVQPGLTVVAPADFEQARSALRATNALTGPVYFRLGKNESNTIAGLDGRFSLGRAEQIGSGADVAIVATGSITLEAARAVAALVDRGVDASLVVVACLSPAPIDDLVAALGSARVAITVEAHYASGGLGSLVCEIVAEHSLGCHIVRRAVGDGHHGISGSERYLNGLHGLSSESVVATALEALDRVATARQERA